MSDSQTPATAGGIEDYSDGPVPQGKTVNGWRVALILIGINLALPGFLNGAQVGSALGLGQALLAALTAGMILCVMGCLTALVSVRSRLTTYVLVQYSFGRIGARIVNAALAATMFGWFGVNASFFGDAMVTAGQQLYGVDGNVDLMILVGSALMIVTTIFGFRALERLALVAVPLLCLILGAVFVLAVRRNGVVTEAVGPHATMGFGIAISAIVGANMVTIATMPDLARYIVSGRQAVLGMALSFPLATPALMLAAAVPSLATGETDIMRIIIGLGLGVPALLVLVLSTWTCNAANLYSAGLGLATTVRVASRWQLTIVAGALGALLAIAGIIDAFVPFLLLLGIIVPPVAAIYVVEGLAMFRHGYDPVLLAAGPPVRWPALATWTAASGIALMTAREWFTLSGVPALDAALVAGVLHWLMVRRAAPTVPAVFDAGAL